MPSVNIYLTDNEFKWLKSQPSKSKIFQELVDERMKKEKNESHLEDELMKIDEIIAQNSEKRITLIKRLKIIFDEIKEKQTEEKGRLKIKLAQEELKLKQIDENIEKIPILKELLELRPTSPNDEKLEAFRRKLLFEIDYKGALALTKEIFYDYLKRKGVIQ